MTLLSFSSFLVTKQCPHLRYKPTDQPNWDACKFQECVESGIRQLGQSWFRLDLQVNYKIFPAASIVYGVIHCIVHLVASYRTADLCCHFSGQCLINGKKTPSRSKTVDEGHVWKQGRILFSNGIYNFMTVRIYTVIRGCFCWTLGFD